MAHQGRCTAVGFRPAPEVWKPGGGMESDDVEPVPRRFRRLRIRRTRPRPEERAPMGEMLPHLVIYGIALLMLAVAVSGIIHLL